MDPETPCRECGHERKWHDPCTVCYALVLPADAEVIQCGTFLEPEEPTDG